MLRRLLPLMVLLSLVCQSFGTVVAAWVCEGKTCSTILAGCCCVQPVAKRDGVCGTSALKAKTCAGKCGCKLTVKSSRSVLAATARHSAPPPTLLDVPAVVPPSFDLPTAPTLTYAPVLPNPPPLRRTAPLDEGAPLRAPPFPFV